MNKFKFKIHHKLSKVDNSKNLINYGNMLAIHNMQIQKEVKSNPKQPSCKKKCVAPIVKSKMVAKKWLDGRLMAKILIMTIQVNLVPNPVEKATQIHLNCCY